MSQFLGVLVAGILLGGIYGLVALGLNLIFGVVRIVNFAQGELVMLGMYATYWLYSAVGINPYRAVFIVAPGMFCVGLVLQRLILQPLQDEPMMQIFATFGLVILFQNLVLGATGGQALSIDWPFARKVVGADGVNLNVARLVVLGVLSAITLGLHIFLRDTMPGRAIRAVIQDRRAARSMGIDVERVFLLTFGVGAAPAGLAGALLAPIFTLSPGIGGNFILAAFAVVVLGGLGSLWAPIWAACWLGSSKSSPGSTKRFVGLLAVDDVSFDVRAGEMVSIIGPNGAGKTTLFNLLTGQLAPTGGEIRFRGEVVNRLGPHRRAQRGMGRTFQVAKPLVHLTVLENAMVGAFARLRGLRRAEEKAVEVLDEVGLLARAGAKASALTLSERRRLEVARARHGSRTDSAR